MIKAEMKNIHELNGILGILIPLIIISLWLSNLIFILFINISDLTIFSLIGSIILRTFLQTGLFITAHDAMHGAISPDRRKINDLIGSIATTCYAFLAYRNLQEKHTMHHRYPASKGDPDFHESSDYSILSWYFKFIWGYLDQRQTWIVLTGIIFAIAILKLGFDVSNFNLILFWILPMVLSSFQLFYFGTFLPHRQPPQGYRDRHRASSTGYSVLWSFVTCYHFGYHWEHHEYPNSPWYKLPALRSDTRLPLT